MTILILIEPIDPDDGVARSRPRVSGHECTNDRDALRAQRDGNSKRRVDGEDDPLSESWQKLLAKYRRR